MTSPGRSAESSPVRFVLRGRRTALGLLASTAFAGGAAEAVFLVLVTRTAFAVTDGDDRVGIVAGWSLTLSWTLLVGFTLLVIRLLLAVASAWQAARLSTGVVADVRREIADAFLHASWETQQGQRAGSLQELLTTFSGSTSGMMAGLMQLVLSGANLVAMLALAIAVDPAGALILVLSVGVLGLMLKPLRSAVRRRSKANQEAGMDFAVSLNEVSNLGLELHVFHVQRNAAGRVSTLIDETQRRGARAQFAVGLATPLYTAMAYLAVLGALAVVASSNTTDLTSLGAVMLVMLRSLSYGQAVQNAYTTIASTSPAIEELRAKLAEFSVGRRQDGGEAVGHVGTVVAENVSFAYTPSQPVLHRLDFAIAPREIIGIVGPSGSGKSTLVQLLLGLRDPTEGRILVDGRDLRSLRRDEWARRVTFVPQAAHFINGSITDNIRFLRDDITDEQVVRAASLAHLHDDVLRTPEGYDRSVGEHGGHLSGGQQQRLCIARALVESPDLLILDEPTSALDVRSEHLIRTTLLGLKESMTIVVIAHRLSTLDICDRIMVIQDGELKGFDTPEVLERDSDFFREALTLSGLR